MGKLDGKIALIAGGTGGVGSGIVRGFLQEGATVVVPSRSPEKAEQLCEHLSFAIERLVLITKDIRDSDAAQQIRDEILDRFGRLDAVVAALGMHWQQDLTLIEIPVNTWHQYMESNLTSHFIVARTFLPVLAQRRGTSYTFINGNSADLIIPKYSPISVTSAGQLKITQTVVEEMKGSSIRINSVILGLVHTPQRAADAKPEWITPNEVGTFTAWLASDEARMVSGSLIRLYERPPIIENKEDKNN